MNCYKVTEKCGHDGKNYYYRCSSKQKQAQYFGKISKYVFSDPHQEELYMKYKK